MTSLFIFRRDLRLSDNTALIKALSENSEVITVFIFTPIQTEENGYFSENAFQILIESLRELEAEIKLFYFFGSNIEALSHIYEIVKFQKVYFNRDYTPYAKSRDQQIQEWCQNLDIEVDISEDYTLFPNSSVKTQKGDPYQVFKSYYDNVMKREFPSPVLEGDWNNLTSRDYLSEMQVTLDQMSQFYTDNPDLAFTGGRQNGLKQLQQTDLFQNYESTKDYPQHNTTLLSAHIKFGTVSIREVMESFISATSVNSELVRQLIWHDFYASLLDNLEDYDPPREFGENFKWNTTVGIIEVPWDNDEDLWQAWTQGNTGFPFVDAGIRQLVTSGWMHNQARMVVANVLSLLFRIDWRWGEQFFAQNLADYDVSSNQGNWLWSVQLGIDRPRKYPRIFNPFKYSADKDPEAIYIKRWIPELAEVPAKDIHKWAQKYQDYKVDYPEPIVNYETRRDQAQQIWNQAIGK